MHARTQHRLTLFLFAIGDVGGGVEGGGGGGSIGAHPLARAPTHPF